MGVGSTNPDDINYETLYSEEINVLANQGCGYVRIFVNADMVCIAWVHYPTSWNYYPTNGR